MELRKGTLLQGGKYRIVKKLGQGSFGITYLAKAKFTTVGALGYMGVEANVAIKEFFMSDVNSRKSDGSTVEGSNGTIFSNYRKKFKKEAENLSKLEHERIVKVYDVFDENCTTYYSMEYVDGENLDDFISHNNPIDEVQAIDIIHRVCDALALMHGKQMLHLDLKPKNIMRSSHGEIYLIDFGLSKQFNADGEPESSTSIGLGTPGYAPLEQAKFIKDGTFPATLDIYALGATMYKILTGRRPHDASEILNEGFSKDLLRKYGRSEAMIGIVEKCMSPMKKDRFQQIRDLINSLPKIEAVNPIENDNKISIDEGTNINISKSRKKKRKTRQETSSNPADNKAETGTRQFVNFPKLPTSITLHLLGEDNNWSRLTIHQRYILGEYDRYFRSIGSKKITKDEYINLIKGLDSLISKSNSQSSNFESYNLSIWYEKSKSPDYYILNNQTMSMLCDLIPYNKEYRLYRFVNGNGFNNKDIDNATEPPFRRISSEFGDLLNRFQSKVFQNFLNKISENDTSGDNVSDNENVHMGNNTEPSYNEGSIIPKFTAFRNSLNKFSKDDTIWHDIKLTIGLTLPAIILLFAIFSPRSGNTDKKKSLQPTINDHYNYSDIVIVGNPTTNSTQIVSNADSSINAVSAQNTIAEGYDGADSSKSDIH